MFGSEGVGLSKAILQASHGFFSIPMYGLTESLNVSVTVAICAHFARGARLRAMSKEGWLGQEYTDLTEQELRSLR